MPIGTSDGQYFEDDFAYATQALNDAMPSSEKMKFLDNRDDDEKMMDSSGYGGLGDSNSANDKPTFMSRNSGFRSGFDNDPNNFRKPYSAQDFKTIEYEMQRTQNAAEPGVDPDQTYADIYVNKDTRPKLKDNDYDLNGLLKVADKSSEEDHGPLNKLYDKLSETWPAETLDTFKKILMLPGKVFRGDIAPDSDEAINTAAEFALAFGTGGLESAGKEALKDTVKKTAKDAITSPLDTGKIKRVAELSL